MGARQIERTGGLLGVIRVQCFCQSTVIYFFGSYFTREPQRVSSFATAMSKMDFLSMLQLEYDSKEFVKICPAQNFMKIEETQNRHILPQSNDCMAIRAHNL